MRRLLVALSASALLLAAASPALAQTGVSAGLSGVSNGQTITGGVTLRGSASAAAGVKSLTILINNSPVKSASYDDVQSNASIDYGWSTGGGRNGEYLIKVRATGNGGSSDEKTARVYVDNAPSTPSGVSASQTDGVVTVSWSANPEPDIIAYRVERDGGSGWATAGQTSSTSLMESPGPGNFSYRVTALRSSPSTSGGKPSSPSGSAAVTVPQPPPTSAGSDGTGSSGGAGTGSSGGGIAGSGSGGGNSGGGGGVPGYGDNSASGRGGKNGGAGGPGSNGGGGVPLGYGGTFTAGGRSLGSIGLPGTLSLPGRPGSRVLSSTAAPAAGDGTFEEALPYDLDVPGSSRLDNGGFGIAAISEDWSIIPPDGLRWVAAGLLFMVAAAALKFLERRVAASELASAASASDATPSTSAATPSTSAAAEPVAEQAPATVTKVPPGTKEMSPVLDHASSLVKTPVKTTAKKTPARKTTAKTPAKKTAARKATAKAPAKTHAARKTTAKAPAKTPARKTTAKGPAKTTAARKTTAKKTAARKTAAKKTTARKTSVTKPTAKEAPTRAGARKTAPGSAADGPAGHLQLVKDDDTAAA
jgi:hypothetical protein